MRKRRRSLEELIASSGYDPSDPLLTVNQAAAVLTVSPETVRRWLRKDAYPYQRIGPARRLLRIRRSVVESMRSEDADGSTPRIDAHNAQNTPPA